MKSKLMQLPREVLVGGGVIKKVNDMCRDLNLDGNALVVSGNKTFKIAGKKVCDILGEEYDTAFTIIDSPTRGEVEKVKDTIKNKDIRFVIGVGGGKVIDVAKLASKEKGIEFLSLPTVASHDGIASSRASIHHDHGSVSIRAHAPLGVIADTSIIKKAPYRFLASGCGDMIANYTSIKDWELAHKEKGEEFSEYSATLSLMTAKIIMDSCDIIKKGTEESVRKVVKALISSGVSMSIAGSSRPASGSEHKFGHALDSIAPKPALHGEQVGVGTIMMMYLHDGDWMRIRDSLRKIGAPTSARELDIEDRYIIKALVNARKIRPNRYTILEKKQLTSNGAREVARETGVIE